jgi:hypothetical protein
MDILDVRTLRDANETPPEFKAALRWALNKIEEQHRQMVKASMVMEAAQDALKAVKP